MITDEEELRKRYITPIIISAGIIILIILLILIIILTKNNDTKINIDFSNLCNNNIYDGNTKQLSNLESNKEYTISNNEGIDSGEYSIIIKANEGYRFKDSKEKEKTITCTIDKANPELIIDKESLLLNKNQKRNIIINTNIEGELSFIIDENIAKIAESNKINKNLTPVTINISAINTGITNLQITFTPSNQNYNTIVKNIEINVSKYQQVTPPTNNICKKIIYNGETQKLVSKTDYTGYTLKGHTEGKDPGVYKIEAELKNGYIWSDGKTENKIISCTISNTAIYSLNVPKTTCKVGNSIFIVVSSKRQASEILNDDGVRSIKNNTNITKVTKNNTCQNSTAKECIYPGQYEVKCLKEGTDTITIETETKEILKTTITVTK